MSARDNVVHRQMPSGEAACFYGYHEHYADRIQAGSMARLNPPPRSSVRIGEVTCPTCRRSFSGWYPDWELGGTRCYGCAGRETQGHWHNCIYVRFRGPFAPLARPGRDAPRDWADHVRRLGLQTSPRLALTPVAEVARTA